ncbi:hypothetical protein AB0N38_14185 [Micromonospora aurantiaca]|uniref:hypothetical protein n=1 Tax=Micromonospora aurantiaca (nom. illeg.) TaxID=47850 RepID=UPI003436C7A3
MTGTRIAGAALIATTMLGIIAASSWAIADQHGWRVAATVWSTAVALTATIAAGAYLMTS